MRVLARVVLIELVVATAAAAAPAAADAPLSLQECVREALAANPDLGAATARAEAADAAAAAVAAGRRPRLDVTAGYLYSERAQRLTQPSFQGEVLRYDNDIADATVEARLPLYTGGILTARVRAAERAAAAARMAAVTTRQDLTLNVIASYLAAVVQRMAVAAVQGSLDALEAQLSVARTLEELGRIAPLDRLKVEVRAAEVRQTLSRARRDRELILHHLATLLGRGPGRALPEVSEAPPPIPLDTSPDAFVAEALAARPEVAAARHEVDQAREQLAIVTGERRPAIDAYARYTARSVVPADGGDLPDHVKFGSGGVTFRLPLWTGGELAARIAEARARVTEADERLRAVELRVTEEVRRELAGHAEALEREGVARGALQQARDAFAIERANYELGRSFINDVLDAQAALLDAELAHARASYDLALASVAVARAAGRDVAALFETSGKEGR